MHIKTVVIDGFKSYAQRTEVSGFDPQFNAITGLNGSGKSNILDSICFLLGITNLSQVRASSLQELVYKGGQAGVTKATVTITFDNTDKNQSPVGYELYNEITVSRQVVIGGRNKYLINGTNATPSRVQDLFRSVQLNVNNPHFLIMQGRITKVLNMKPPEILSMIEEAAGTRLYESKRASAQKTIEKKDMKLKEIDSVLTEEITPTLKKLKEERSSFLEYQKIVQEVEHLSRLHVAYQFLKAEAVCSTSTTGLEDIRKEKETMLQEIAESEERLVELNDKISQLEARREKDSKTWLRGLEKDLEEKSKVLTLAETKVKHCSEQLVKETKLRDSVSAACQEDEAALVAKETEVSTSEEAFREFEEECRRAEEAVQLANKHYQAVSAGMSTSADGQAETLAQQKIACENQISASETEIAQAQMRLKSHREELKEKEQSWKECEKSYKKEREVLDKAERELNKLQADMRSLDYSEGCWEKLSAQKDTLEKEVVVIKRRIEQMETKFPQLQFEYTLPNPRFDQRKVKGPVAKLIRLKDPATATALEVSAGGKLYNIVVDTEETGKDLLQNGKLKRRYTIIPLNKIVSRTIQNDKVKQAQGLVGKAKARPALSLIGYADELDKAMGFVFGSSFVCSTMEDAKKVTFHKGVLTRSVTLAGEVFDPSGTLTGGSTRKSSSVLSELQRLIDAERELEDKEKELAAVQEELRKIQMKADNYRKLKDQFELKSHEADLVRARVEQSTLHQKLSQLKSLQDSVAKQEEAIKLAKESKAQAKSRLEEIAAKMKDSKSHHERELKKAEKDMNDKKKAAEKITKSFKARQQEIQAFQLEMQELKSSIQTQREQIATYEETVKNLSDEVEKLSEKETEARSCMETVKSELDERKRQLKERNQELHECEEVRRRTQEQKESLKLQLKELDHRIARIVKDSKEASRQVEALLVKYEWIASDKQYFGKPNTAYDFEVYNPQDHSRLAKLQEQKEKLGKSVNMRAMNMLGQAEERYNDLIKKKQIVENDKAKIVSVIEELDQKKNMVLEEAWKRVNEDFGSIFSTLLPGTTAKLEPPQGQTVLDGLEVKVAFSGVWKESLTELSGGQRSLVALSLILSMLLFKPAPLYILDEVDAALDLSHTQNIGQMLQTHFRHSQFIVVSLKEGMFNNANVIFRTKFIDGVSTVSREVNKRVAADKKGSKVPSTATQLTKKKKTTA